MYDEENNVVRFEIVDDVIKKVQKGTYPYVVRMSDITDAPDEEIWEDGAFEFEVRCGYPSFRRPSEQPVPTTVALTEWEIDDQNPWIRLPIFEPYFTDCHITDYELLHDDGETVYEEFDQSHEELLAEG